MKKVARMPKELASRAKRKWICQAKRLDVALRIMVANLFCLEAVGTEQNSVVQMASD